MTSLLEHNISHLNNRIPFFCYSVEYESTKIRLNFRKQTISTVEVIKKFYFYKLLS